MNATTIRYICCIGVLWLAVTGCTASHYATMQHVQQAVQIGDYQLADDLLSREKQLAEGKDRLLYLLEKGLIAHLNGEYWESNRMFELAAARMEELDYISVTGTASEWILNATAQPYQGEDFERVLVHYYMALNYLLLDELEEALVECRRLNTLLRMLNDRYETKNVYKTDAFILYLSGLIYEAMGATNDAFIDYRNAYDTYTSDYLESYGTPPPSQLQENLLRTASALDFMDLIETYGFQDTTWPAQWQYRESARLVIIWDNGLIPYKIQHAYRDYIEFDEDEDEGCYLKFAFPEFVFRFPAYSRATVNLQGRSMPLELAEDISQIAIKNLEDRRMRTIAQAITRNVLKCAAEQEIREHNEALGWLFSVFTELSEQADTRSWLLLPANIYIAQVLVPPGVSDVEIHFSNAFGQNLYTKTYENITFQRGKTTFLLHRTF